jgi:hypothetical protein
MDLYGELNNILDLLESHHIDYALCGGIAVAFYGYTRFTKDIDILMKKDDLTKCVAYLKGIGYLFDSGIIPFDKGTPKEREVYRISKIEGEDILTLDIVLVTSVFESIWKEREYYEWKGRKIQVVSFEGLIKMKKLAGRDQDLLDLKKLGWKGSDN